MPVQDLLGAAGQLARAQREAGLDIARSVGACRATVSLVRLLDGCGEAPLGQLAGSLRVDLSVASRQVSQAVQDGHVERSIGPDDRRIRTVRLTPAGQDLAARLHQESADRAAVTFADWTDDELTAAATTLRRLADALTPRTTGHPARTIDES
ncbi:MarR family winged helix-turn-helix transcriptional regulator [Cellulomonas soli]|uniref:HTH marR-type domain-containing protein n=1 Tax=Cellulomonas soli TaxID=931535 RepID=A0A512PGG4_9CELL|nr:MarR family winged helix-turn-helix transcriptional regulator [Cellulomonas soli]NYI58155.1 DNA-binding MarR family transcriptional regulator [Cellulomonas soli]GEP70288.1 hypothetical protein CSO01_30030 [Cellulomonas soli]